MTNPKTLNAVLAQIAVLILPCMGKDKCGDYYCEEGSCCGERLCCTHYYYQMWWFWTLWGVIGLLGCCCYYQKRRIQNQLQHNVLTYQLPGSESDWPQQPSQSPQPLFDPDKMLRLPTYEEANASPPGPPPYDVICSATTLTETRISVPSSDVQTSLPEELPAAQTQPDCQPSQNTDTRMTAPLLS